MDYVDIETAKGMDGLRLVLVGGIPSPWSEAAKAFCAMKGLPFTPIAQKGNRPNEDLVAWTGYRNAPVMIHGTERPRAHWLEILLYLERLRPEPALLPTAVEERIQVIGLSQELCGELGLGWWGRQIMMDSMVQALGEDMAKTPMFPDYGYSAENVAAAPGHMTVILDTLTERLNAQARRGSPYFIGDQMTAVDVYWACFSLLVNNLPPEQNPMPDVVRQMWAASGSAAPDVDPILIAHRDRMFATHLSLPLDF